MINRIMTYRMMRYLWLLPMVLIGLVNQISEASEKRVRVSDLKEHQIDQQNAAKSLGSPWLSSRLLVPHLTVFDVVESKEFYAAAFGFKVRFEDQPKEKSQHVEMSYRDELILMFVPQNVRGSGTAPPRDFINPQQLTAYFYLYVESVDEVYQNALNASAISITAPYDSAWGDRFAIVADPNGYHWGLAESKNMILE